MLMEVLINNEDAVPEDAAARLPHFCLNADDFRPDDLKLSVT